MCAIKNGRQKLTIKPNYGPLVEAVEERIERRSECRWGRSTSTRLRAQSDRVPSSAEPIIALAAVVTMDAALARAGPTNCKVVGRA